MNDLYSVGPQKPMGYLPLSTLEKFSDKNEEGLTKELNEKGVEVILIEPGPDTFVFSGAMYAYHPEALQKLLNDNKNIWGK